MADATRASVVIAVTLLTSACSPSLYPLYQDYEITADKHSLQERIEGALVTAGWNSSEGPSPNVIATNERTIRHWGLYSVTVELEIMPVGDNYVRLLVHPYREYAWGTRSKIPFMNVTIRRAVLRDINKAMSAQGLVVLGTGVSRDRE